MVRRHAAGIAAEIGNHLPRDRINACRKYGGFTAAAHSA
jgi:hypothetical protein